MFFGTSGTRKSFNFFSGYHKIDFPSFLSPLNTILLYFAGFGFADWMSSMGTTFLLMLFVVLIPCSLSDIVIPIWFAKKGK